MPVATGTTNDENGGGLDILAWQMAGAWIPAFAGMTDGGSTLPNFIAMTSDPVRLHSVEFATVVVTPWTEWAFARLRAVGGACADVEITADGDVVRLVEEMVDSLKGDDIRGEADVARLLGVDERRARGDLALATALSAVRTGVSIIQAVEDGDTLTESLGGEKQDSVQLYANINRGLFATARTPADFAKGAERAVGEGFRAVKCAPFDEVTPGDGSDEAVRQARFGIQRVAAVRDAVGPDVTVMVDCHGRFDIESAVKVAEDLAELGINWFEEPIRPNKHSAESARIAARVQMTVAGGEMGYGEELFADLIEGKAVEVIMPDVMFCGGAAVAARSGRAAIVNGGGVSLHSPSGPVSLLTGGHVMASVPGAMALEHAVHEADWRADLLTPPERVEDGCLHLPCSAGLGAELDWEFLRRVGRVWGH